VCGICGIAHGDVTERVDPSVIRRMSDAIRHRGPDDRGQFVSGPVGLGMRRLSIIDVEQGAQPVTNEASTVHAICNGEIYNYRALREALRSSGHHFRAHSDVEVIPHAYEDADVGADLLSRLQGMFALAVWDGPRRTALLAVDRFGIKPLYYSVSRQGLVFGSELKCLLVSGMISQELDFEALAQYFTLGYIPAPYTVFRSVRKLSAGHFLRWTPDEDPVVEPYWRPPPASAQTRRHPAETNQMLRTALRESVRAHMVSDVPLGAFLSGGVDSSAVVALMSEVSSEPVKTFSIGFSDPRFSELPKARLVAQRFGTDHHEMIVEPQHAELLTDLVAHFDEPFADPSALPTYHVSKLARESVKVALSGDGGDELFVGYTMFQGLELARLAGRAPRWLREGTIRAVNEIPSVGRPDWNDRVAQWRTRLSDTFAPPADAYRSKLASPGLGSLGRFLSAELRRELAAHNPYATIDRALRESSAAGIGHPLDPYLHAALTVTLAGDMLVKVDRMSMANSLEVRVPLLDHVLLELVASIPVAQRFRHWRLKGLLKDCMADVLPAETLAQGKTGFNVPLAAWFRGDLQPFAREVLTSPRARERGLLDVDAIEQLLGHHAGGQRNLGTTIWSLLMFELWCLQYLDA